MQHTVCWSFHPAHVTFMQGREIVTPILLIATRSLARGLPPTSPLGGLVLPPGVGEDVVVEDEAAGGEDLQRRHHRPQHRGHRAQDPPGGSGSLGQVLKLLRS